MKELFDKVWRALPAYFGKLLELLSHPKIFIRKLNVRAPGAVKDGLTFIGITVFVTLVAQAPGLLQMKDVLPVATIAVISVLGLLLSVGALSLAWRVVGGKLNFKTYFIVSCYVASVSTLLFLVFVLVAVGVLNALDPVHAPELLKGDVSGGALNGVGAMVYLGILAVGVLGTLVWISVVWGAFRELNSLSKTRSAVAFAIFVTLSFVVLALEALMGSQSMAELQGTKATTASKIPPELLGVWHSESVTKSEGIPSDQSIVFSFNERGYYFQIVSDITRQGSCIATIMISESGPFRIDGSTMRLAPNERHRASESSCSKEKSEVSVEAEKEVYHYVIREQPTGWMLCLNGRFGEHCLLPKKSS